MLHVTLIKDGIDHGGVGSGNVDVHIDVNGHLLSTLRAPEINLQRAPDTNSYKNKLWLDTPAAGYRLSGL